MGKTGVEKKSNAFKKLDSSGKMIKFLCDGHRLKDYSSLHHYTSVKNLISMLQSGYLYLGNPKNMNDQHELSCGDSEIWSRTYFTSFMAESSESIGMWSMYGQPWTEGVRISIPKEVCKKWCKQAKQLYIVDGNHKCTEDIVDLKSESTSFWLEAVVYTDFENGEYCNYWGGENNKVMKNLKAEPSLTGFVKDNAWSYEKEIRLKVTLKDPINCDKLAIKFTDEVINSLTITPSPLFEGDFMEKLDNEIKSKVKEENLSESLFHGKLQYVDPCKKCEKINNHSE